MTAPPSTAAICFWKTKGLDGVGIRRLTFQVCRRKAVIEVSLPGSGHSSPSANAPNRPHDKGDSCGGFMDRKPSFPEWFIWPKIGRHSSCRSTGLGHLAWGRATAANQKSARDLSMAWNGSKSRGLTTYALQRKSYIFCKSSSTAEVVRITTGRRLNCG